jgi:hypothetical protein
MLVGVYLLVVNSFETGLSNVGSLAMLCFMSVAPNRAASDVGLSTAIGEQAPP